MYYRKRTGSTAAELQGQAADHRQNWGNWHTGAGFGLRICVGGSDADGLDRPENSGVPRA